MADAPVAVDSLVTISDSAAKKIRELLQEEGNPNYALRLQVVGGGCAGFQYKLAFDDEFAEDDELLDYEGFRVVVDPMSARYVEGATIDYVESEMASGFKIENPNVVTTCGCGHSHSF
ncbi:MAG TPA: iron-sulfur cluster insertion protein ErpA [Candidatus Latescibacteria bacterium]|nr:iron-sulfur cluster insertion protein ErpA [Candidatus Latescibacterota bacterium]HOS63568.1 iron-sulfur cluster insertion protein ErpA [Candidatus Latescibacterota bacterium]HPK73318.1 iron-sulfur cluster insertion protein ErpA [Candidatus Latescibacterota bacterium]HQI75032.1 iron-sulfur cluster insertion protein ErpA [Candidatus Latescibacterota bacterium]